MGERKVLNKWIPPDFDPAKMPRGHREAMGRMEVRMMLPMNVQCVTCGEFMYRGKKVSSICCWIHQECLNSAACNYSLQFNAKKEDVVGKEYLGMKLYRFIMKCTACNAPFSITTDPEHMDYAVR
jgi:hypothetical protein